ncbi:hypothetical protein [Mesorhizobium sp. CO1-1-8]|uniref:hypothetical protein n=1 Tax=Mesorhizobium sp. CO1-1-8 TaxID=2876631 RepID=UPI001CD0544A|nr:hypothetical protein [Mesorhizobium sp. CO1-1-8]MBZ9773282.1 hypothetical protein [Mesorhizobium sp. CO1-1-8]
MKEKSAAELEREAEAARARVMETAESIRGKMTPGQLLDEFTGLFSGGESSAMLANLRTQVRDNPLPVTMVGAGLAWLMFGSGTANTAHGSAGSMPSAPGRHDEGERGGLGSTFSDAAASLSSAATSVSDTVSSTASSAVEGLTGSTANARSVTGEMAAKATRSAQDLFENQPLAVAAAGLAIGAAIGAMLPHTATEDEQLGAYGDKLRDTAETVLDKGLDEAKQVAAEAYETIKQEAGRQHMEADMIADQLGEIVKSTADKTEHAVRERISDPSKHQT